MSEAPIGTPMFETPNDLTVAADSDKRVEFKPVSEE